MHLCAVGRVPWSNNWHVFSHLKFCKRKRRKTKFNSKVGNNPFRSWRHSELGCMEWCCLCSEVPAALQSTQLGVPSCGRWIVESWEGWPLPPLHHPPGELVSQPMDSDQWLKYNSYSYRSQGKHNMTIILSVWEAKKRDLSLPTNITVMALLLSICGSQGLSWLSSNEKVMFTVGPQAQVWITAFSRYRPNAHKCIHSKNITVLVNNHPNGCIQT